MPYKFSKRSLNALTGVHPALVAIAHRALELTTCDFTIVQGLRTIKEQRRLLETGATKTLKSKHLPQADGYGYAIDLYPYYDGKLHGASANESAETKAENARRWRQIAQAFKAAAAEAGAKITWGGDWRGSWDMPHFQLDSVASAASTKAAH